MNRLQEKYDALKRAADRLRDSFTINARLGAKRFDEYSDRQQTRVRTKIRNILLNVSNEFRHYGISLKYTELQESVDEPNELTAVFLARNDLGDNQMPTVEKCMYVKDRNNISDQTYHEISKLMRHSLQPIDKLRNFRKNFLNFVILSDDGRYLKIDAINKIKYHASKYLEGNDADVLRIKLCADGTNVGNSLKFLNFNFTITNDKLRCQTANGHYLLGAYVIENEDYEAIRANLGELLAEIESLKVIDKGEGQIPISYFIGGDMKFLLNFAGLKGANSNFNCLYCSSKSSVALSKNISYRASTYCAQELSVINIDKQARSLQESATCRTRNKLEERLGYDNPPISPNIQFHDYIIDSLHLFLRISDKLFALFIYNLGLLESNNVLAANLHYTQTRYIVHFGNYLENVCKLRNVLKAEESTFKLRSLNGVSRSKIFFNSRFLFQSLLSTDLQEAHKLQLKHTYVLWNNFYHLYRLIKENRLSEQGSFFERKCGEWLRLFLDIYSLDQVTPYMHIFVFHVHELNRLHGNINIFNQEGHEKFNDIISKDYFRSSNKWDNFMLQIVKKINRIEYYSYEFGNEKTRSKKRAYEQIVEYLTDSNNFE